MKSLQDIISPAASLSVRDTDTFGTSIAVIDKARSGMALVTDSKGNLQGILTDGDIRRAVLKGISLDEPVGKVMVQNPVTVTTEFTKGEISRIFAERGISHLPVVEGNGKLVGVIFESTMRKEGVLGIPVVIMAGGLGTRLRPMTEKTPKPMLEIAGKPILEHLIARFRDLGASDFYITVNYLAETIENYFGNGKKLRVNIRYVREEKPLGTAGALNLLPADALDSEIFVINADVLTDMDFRTMHSFHLERKAAITVAIKRHDLEVPYGIVTVLQDKITSLSEKPIIQNFINAGVYVLNREVAGRIPADTRFDMTDLIGQLLSSGGKVFGFLIEGSWIDIGQRHDYEFAKETYTVSEGS